MPRLPSLFDGVRPGPSLAGGLELCLEQLWLSSTSRLSRLRTRSSNVMFCSRWRAFSMLGFELGDPFGWRHAPLVRLLRKSG